MGTAILTLQDGYKNNKNTHAKTHKIDQKSVKNELGFWSFLELLEI